MGTNSLVNKKCEDYLKSNSVHWMYCPRCFLVPSIKPFLMNNELYISLYCKCLYEEKEFMSFDEYINLIMNKKITLHNCKKHKSTEAIVFCISCEKWLCDFCFSYHKEKYEKHLYNKVPIRLKEYCHRHEKELAVSYCNNCSKNVCENCKIAKIKLRHDLFNFDNKENVSRCDKKWNQFMDVNITYSSGNEKLKDEINNLIINSKDIKEEEKVDLKNRINNAYLKNQQINHKLSEYILFLYSNYHYSFLIGKIVNRNIFNNIYNVKIENSSFSINPELSVVQNAEKLIKFFNNVHFLQLNPLINIKNITSERQNVTKQISKICLLDKNNVATLTSKGIIIIWNYLTYDELYRIKKISISEKTYLEKNENNLLRTNTLDNLQNYFLGDEEDDNEFNGNLINERIIRQQTHIFNLIQNNNHINNIQENKRRYILKVYHVNNSAKLNSSSDMCNQNDINDKINEDEEEAFDFNLNFISMAFIPKNNILCLIIEECKDIYMFDIMKKEGLKEKLIGHKKEILDILALKNGELASYGNDFSLRIWNIKRFQNVCTINVEIKRYYIYFTQLLYGNLIFATGESTIKILKLPEFEFDKDIESVPRPMNYFELPDKRLIIASDDFYVRILKPPDYKEIIFLFNKKRTKIYSFLLLDMNRLLVGLEEHNSIQMIFLNDKTHKNIASHFSPIGSLIKTNDSKNNRVISISWDNVTKIFLIGN